MLYKSRISVYSVAYHGNGNAYKLYHSDFKISNFLKKISFGDDHMKNLDPYIWT